MPIKWKIRQWEPTLEDARAVRDIWKTCSPLYTFSPPELMLEKMQKSMRGFEDGFRVVLSEEDQIIGYVRLNPTSNENELNLNGGVLPAFRGQGIGLHLLQKSLAYSRFKNYPKIRSWFLKEDARTFQFMQKAGFTLKDQLFWSTWKFGQPIPAWVEEKSQKLKHQGIQIISGLEFSQLHDNWDWLWWKHMMTCLQDVPSTIPFEETPFERFKKFLYPPFLNIADSLIAVEGKTLAGILMLSNVQDKTVNINHTSVSRNYRRKGISIALKYRAMQRVDGKQIHTIGTQNHEHNPMFQINQSIGFQHVATQLETQKILE